jgi:hypothetical protein
MRKVSETEQAALLDVLRRHEADLWAYPGVQYVDVGFKFVGGQPTEQLAIRVHVGLKMPEKELVAVDILPVALDGVPLDVIQSNPGLEQTPDARFDPLVGGTAVSNARLGVLGTLGMVVFDVASGAPMGLSNYHVLVGLGGQVGDPIVQPGLNTPENVIGTLSRWNLTLDCAVCTLNGSRGISSSILSFPSGVAGPTPPVIGMAVAKSGRTTGTTRGIIDGVSAAECTMIPDPASPAPTGEISAGGDSGSVWIEVESAAAVGLHYAGETDPNPSAERAWAKRMVNVVNALNVVLLRPTHHAVFATREAEGIGGYRLLSTADRMFAFDFDHSGKANHLAVYRPGAGQVWILKNEAGTFSPVFAEGDGMSGIGLGIGGYNLHSPADQAFAFDFDHSGKLDHIVLYRPGTGAIYILKNVGGTFTPVYAQGDLGAGIGGYNLRSTADRAFAFDFDHSGKLDHIALYRPGTGIFWILKNSGGVFTPVFAEGVPDATIGMGIGGYNLHLPADQAFAFDFDHSGLLDYLVLYRPGTGAIYILRNTGGMFAPVYAQGDQGNGIGGYALRSAADRALALDYERSGKLDHIALYRPGTGAISIVRNAGGVFTPMMAEAEPGNGIGGFNLRSPVDRAIAFDFEHSGKADHLLFYRPGKGAVRIMRPV